MHYNIIYFLTSLVLPVAVLTAPTEHIVIKTIRHAGQVIDYIPRSSQGEIAQPPPLLRRTSNPGRFNGDQVFPRQTLTGPAGSVPILRSRSLYPPKRLPQISDHHNATAIELQKRDYSSVHWYASSNQIVTNRGGGARINMYDAYLESANDFSLMQMAAIRTDVPNDKNLQTVEAGWMKYPVIKPGGPFLFVYYTTVGYSATGDYIGGYNQAQKGWVQYDSQIFPGIQFTPVSTVNGSQSELRLQYRLYQGNWWLFVMDRWIGYFPAALFSAGTDFNNSLASSSSYLAFFGETYNSGGTLTTTDMGSGYFAEGGYRKAAYIRNIQYIDTNDRLNDYDAGNAVVVSDPKRYSLLSRWKSGTAWGSYMFVGGPGAGGVIGG